MAKFEFVLTSGISILHALKMSSLFPELIIDVTTGYETMSFMDGSFGYNQICMALKDVELTILRTPKESYEGTNIRRFSANHPIPDDCELTDEIPDEDVMYVEIQPLWKMYFDGATHRGRDGAGMVFITSQEEILPFSFTLKQHCSYNVVEYQALILGHEMVVDMKQLHLQVFGDHQLVINQLLGSYEVKKPEFCPYQVYAKEFIGWLGDITFQHVPKMENKKVDVLAALALTLTLPVQT
ncbi:uncharacterized protein LOC125873700 [Solanum stenotomum]|uniref:uncharacterized protein LOC125873700 n=1 Tax=Solanum stenotomum TaxID=172797 RepID=UPI0020D0AF01|nr:uncharacterized protein LOC125873700 [Solanum stenotomum]